MPLTLLIIARGFQIGASLLLAGIFSFELFVLRSPGDPGSGDARVMRRLLRLAWWSAIAALLSALLWFAFEVTSMSHLPLAAAFSGTSWRAVLFETRFGDVWRLRLAFIAICLFLILLRRLTDQWEKAFRLLLWLLASTLLVSLAWISHPAAVAEQPLGLVGDALHLTAAGVWLGGLPCLALYLAMTDDATSPQVLKRFSSLSLGCVVVLVAGGLSNAWLLIGSAKALFTTRYGALLLGKLVLFALLIALGARNRLRVTGVTLGTASGLLGRLRREVGCEIALGFGVIAIVGWLGVTPPPRSEPASAATARLARLQPESSLASRSATP